MSGLIGAGDLYIDRLDDLGNSTGLRLVGNATRLAIQEPSESQQRIGRGRTNFGQVLDEVSIKQPGTLNITLDEIDADNLAAALLGDAAVLNVAGSSVTDEAVTGIHDAGVQLANRNVAEAPAATVTDDTGMTTYDEGADYTLDLRLGILTVLSTGAITDGQALLVSYTHEGVTGRRISGGVRPTIRAKLFLDGRNLADGKPIQVTIDEANLRPDSEVDFLSTEFTELQLTGSMKLRQGATAPYTVDTLDA